MWQIFTSSNMGPSLYHIITYTKYLENIKATSTVCKNIVK